MSESVLIKITRNCEVTAEALYVVLPDCVLINGQQLLADSTVSNTPWGQEASMHGYCFSWKMCFYYSGRSNAGEEIGFLEAFVNLILQNQIQ